MRYAVCLLLAVLFWLVASSGRAAEDDAAVDPRTLALHQYFYVDFPRALQAVVDQRALLEAEVRVLELRVASYRPFRSFGKYAATYTADLSWQLELVVARQRLACVAATEAELWRQRTIVAAQLAPPSAPR